MIEYVEVRNAKLELISIIDYATSIIWENTYYGAGFFEVFAEATDEAILALTQDNFITLPGRDECGVIEAVEIPQDIANGKYVIASGRMAKAILERRHIYNLTGSSNKATVFSGNVESNARKLVYDNAINCTWNPARNFPFLTLGDSAGLDKIIRTENGAAARKQTSYENLLTYTDELLQEYGYGSKIIFNRDAGRLEYVVFSGVDRSKDNTAGNVPLTFSEDFDNLTSSNYKNDTTGYKNTALVGGAGVGTERYYVVINDAAAGMARRETFIDADSISRTYEDESGTEQTYTDSEYAELLITDGMQKLTEFSITEIFDGAIDMANSVHTLGEDYSNGDIITIQDNTINKYINARITTVTETQDDNGYNIAVEYGV